MPALPLLVSALLAAAAPAPEAVPIERSVARIVNYSQRGNWFAPWDVTGTQESSGSGFVIDGGYVMTNAHVVSDTRLLVLFLHNDPEPHPAEVVFVGHDSDLALVRPRDPEVLRNVPALEFGGLPPLRSTVETYGYPTGGTQVSSTRGVVSRVEVDVYVHSGADRHLVGQTDAAINPGNSGGPVVQEGKVVGVAFQGNPNLQSVGFFVPIDVIARFRKDVSDGTYDGYPELGLHAVGLDNPAPRRRAGMAAGETGVRVDAVFPQASAAGLVQEGDVLLEVDGHAVANDGSVADGDLRLPYGMLVDRRQIGEAVRLRVLRDGRRLDVDVKLRGFPWSRTLAHAYDRLPRYYVHAGLVFVPLELETLKVFGDDPGSIDKPLLHELFVRPLADPASMLDERIVLLRRLDDPVNADMAWYKNQVVAKINGRPIHSLEDVVAAIESNTGDYHVIEFEHFRRIAVVDRREAARAHGAILERYGVGKDRRP